MKRPTPYQLSAVDYAGLGWSPIPLPINEKSPPPDGYTGANGTFVGPIKAEEWSTPGSAGRFKAGNANFPVGNVGLRLPRDVVGIDVDMYEGKAGRETLRKAEEAWGALPPTWMSSSRRDGSGIRLFRVPEGLAWPESLRKSHGGGVELLRWDHRYAIVFPSVHPDTGGVYLWKRPDGEWVTDEVPGVDELTDMPEEWVAGLTAGREWVERSAADLDQNGVREWLSERDGGKPGEVAPCDVMSNTLARYSRQVREAGDDGGAHDEARNGAWALIGDAAAGHAGVNRALMKLREVFLVAVKGRRSDKMAREEWARILMRGVAKVVAEGDPETEDSCAMISGPTVWSPTVMGSVGGSGGGAGRGSGRGGSSAFDWTRDDIGNAQRLVNLYGEDLQYVEGLGGWHIWDRVRWALDRNGQVYRWAMEMVRGMEREANFIEDLKERASFVSFIRSSGGQARLRAMIELSAKMRGMTSYAEEFDADATKLLCPNGVLELRDDGCRFRPVDRQDRITKITRVPYVPDARSEDWDKFLGRSVPDEGVRHWLQKAMGYSMYGRNPGRHLFFIQGRTSSGKSTIVEAVAHALGEYASTFDLALFRSTRDASGSNVAMVKALPRRFIYASETSSEWNLHADQIKRVTGGADRISARLNYSNELVEAIPAFTPWVICNDPPVINGADQALYRRMYTIPFNETIGVDEEDVRLIDRLQAPEGSTAVLAWLVAGWEAYAREGLRDAPTDVAMATLATQEELSEFDAFLRDATRREATACVLVKDLYLAYTSWCEDNGVKDQYNAIHFGRAITKRGYGADKARFGDVQARVRTGLGLRSGWAKRVSATDTSEWAPGRDD